MRSQTPAFAPAAGLQCRGMRLCVDGVDSRSPISRVRVSNPRRCVRMTAAESGKDGSDGDAGGAIDFDAIARKLAADLQAQGVAAPDVVPGPMPGVGVPGAGPTEDDPPFEISTGNGGMPRVMLKHAASAQEVEVYTYGAAVTSWKIRGDDGLWVSDENKWEVGGKAIRGGIPICFPQFGPYGKLVQHGFARVSVWDILETFVAEDGSVSAVFLLTSETEQEGVKEWPHKFSARYTVTLSNAGLETNLQVENTDDKPFDFTMAFHNYIKTTDVSDARIFGCEGLKFYDRLQGDKELGPDEDTGAGLMLSEETDRIYLNSPEEFAMFDFATLKVFKLKKTPSLADATIWNPYGAEGADPGWKQFVCIEPASVTNPTKLEPGEKWIGSQLLGFE